MLLSVDSRFYQDNTWSSFCTVLWLTLLIWLHLPLSDFQDPYAIVVLLQNDLVVVDLTTPGWVHFVTFCIYFF